MDKKEYIIPSVKTHAVKCHLLLVNSGTGIQSSQTGTQQVYDDIEAYPEDTL